MNTAPLDSKSDASHGTTLTSVLDARAREAPEQIAYRFLREGEHETERLGFFELRLHALAVAAQLVAEGATGSRALLLYPQGLAFLSAFFGCLYAGVTAIPVSLPNRKRGLAELRSLADDADASWLLSTSETLDRFSVNAPENALPARLSRLATDRLEQSAARVATLPRVRAQNVALIQYTSGTTASPRGVVVTHENLAENHRQVTASLGGTAGSKYVSWLPMFHDMGLGIALQAVWVGAETILMPPRSFVQEPRRWLAAISRYRATISGGPNFAYDLCVERVPEGELGSLDLGCWRAAFNGSEPVSAETMTRFSQKFGRSGFRNDAFKPVYGLAEATLLVSSEPPTEPACTRHFSAEALAQGEAVAARQSGFGPFSVPDAPRTGPEFRAVVLVSVGRPWPGTHVKIVNPGTHEECAPGHVGEIWIRGRSVAAGYFRRESETRATFTARTALGGGCFLRSGDLGFIEGGRLFVTGRLRDVIVVGGRSHYPQQLEATASGSHAALVPHGAAAFSVGTGTGVVVLQEVSRGALRNLDVHAVVNSIHAAIGREHGVEASVAIVRPATLPRTTSGKIQRARCRAAYLDGALPLLSARGPTSVAAAASEPTPVVHSGPCAVADRAAARTGPTRR